MNPAIAVLASGSSTRFGENKLLAQIGGKSLLSRAVEAALGAGLSQVYVILPNGSSLASMVSQGAMIIYNRNPNEGISGSIRCATEAFEKMADAIIITLADQPFVNSSMLKRLISVAMESAKGIVAYSHKGDPRNPALFRSHYFKDLRQLRGDRGGKKIIMENLQDAKLIEVEIPEYLYDIDTPGQLKKAEEIIDKLGIK